MALTGLGGALVDTDGSETLAFTISGVPAGAAFNRGADLGGGLWRFTPSDMAAGLIFTPPLNARADFPMVLRATATESENASSAFRELPFIVRIDAWLTRQRSSLSVRAGRERGCLDSCRRKRLDLAAGRRWFRKPFAHRDPHMCRRARS